MPAPVLELPTGPLGLDRPRVVGILNVTPDSFYDAGRHFGFDDARARAEAMAREGADLIDVGGESTRPGSRPVPVEVELARVIPLLEALAGELDLPLSVDTSRPEVMRAAVAAGAAMINDVRALRLPGALAAASALRVPVCLMHMQGDPATMQLDPHYPGGVVAAVNAFFSARLAAAVAAGIAPQRLLLDPGFGFGKRLDHNLELLARLPELAVHGRPLLVGLSRKSMFGGILGSPERDRLHGSVAAALLAVERGARLVRVHDVGPTVEALAVWSAVDRAASARGTV